MLNRWVQILLQDHSGSKLPKDTAEKPEQGVGQDQSKMIEELFEIADELDVVMTAFMSPEFKDSESLGLYLILRRQTNRIRLLGTEMCAWG